MALAPQVQEPQPRPQEPQKPDARGWGTWAPPTEPQAQEPAKPPDTHGWDTWSPEPPKPPASVGGWTAEIVEQSFGGARPEHRLHEAIAEDMAGILFEAEGRANLGGDDSSFFEQLATSIGVAMAGVMAPMGMPAHDKRGRFLLAARGEIERRVHKRYTADERDWRAEIRKQVPSLPEDVSPEQYDAMRIFNPALPPRPEQRGPVGVSGIDPDTYKLLLSQSLLGELEKREKDLTPRDRETYAGVAGSVFGYGMMFGSVGGAVARLPWLARMGAPALVAAAGGYAASEMDPQRQTMIDALPPEERDAARTAQRWTAAAHAAVMLPIFGASGLLGRVAGAIAGGGLKSLPSATIGAGVGMQIATDVGEVGFNKLLESVLPPEELQRLAELQLWHEPKLRGVAARAYDAITQGEWREGRGALRDYMLDAGPEIVGMGTLIGFNAMTAPKPITDTQAFLTFIDAKARQAKKEMVPPDATPEMRRAIEREVDMLAADVKDRALGAPSPAARPQQMEGTGQVQSSARDIIKRLSEIGEVPIRTGRALGKPKWEAGRYEPFAHIIRNAKADDIVTAAHEFGHAIHRRFIGLDMSKVPEDVRTELARLGKELYGEQVPSGGYEVEGMAEYVARRFLGDPVDTQAPALHQWMETTLAGQPKLATGFTEMRERFRAFNEQGAVARVKSQIIPPDESFEAWKKGWADTLDRLASRRAWVDELQPLKAAEQKVEREFRRELEALGDDLTGVDVIPPGDKPSRVIQALKGAAKGTAEHFVLRETVNLKGERTGKSLTEAMQPIKPEQAGDFFAYLYAARAEVVRAQGKEPGITQADAQHVLQKLDRPEFRTAVQEFTDYSRRVLDYLVEAGGMTPELRAKLELENSVYMPLRRHFEEHELVRGRPGSASGGVAGKAAPAPVKRLKGSTRGIQHPIDSIAAQTYEIILAANRMRAARSLKEFAQQYPGAGGIANRVEPPKDVREFVMSRLKKQIEEQGLDLEGVDLDATLTLFGNLQAERSAKPIVVLVENGKPEFWEIPDRRIYDAITGMDAQLGGAVVKFFGWATPLVRTGAVGASATFMLKNPLRDIISAAVQSDTGRGFLKVIQKAAEGVGVFAGKPTEAERKLSALGAGMSTLLGSMRERNMSALRNRIMHKPLADRARDLIQRPWLLGRGATNLVDAVARTFAKGEMLPRLAEFEAALARAKERYGDTDKAALEALLATKDVTTDFTRAGALAKHLNLVYPFFNARIQGASKFVRTLADHPVRATAMAIGGITVPALVHWWLHRDDPDWQDLPDHEKKDWTHWRIGDQWIRVPKPFEWGQVFDRLPVRWINDAYREFPQEVDEYLWETLGAFIPIGSFGELIPSGLKPAMEVAFNFDTFRDRPIVSPFQERSKEDADLYTRYTTETAKAIGKLLNVSPAKVEHVMGGYTGGMLPFLVRKGEEIAGVRESAASGGIPVVESFVRDVGKGQSQAVADLYDKLAELTKKHGSGTATAEEEGLRKRLGRVTRRWSKWRQQGDTEAIQKAMRDEARRMQPEIKRSGSR